MYSSTPDKFPHSGFIRLDQVLKLIPVSKSTWWNGCKSGRFPSPYKLGPRTTAWKTIDIVACMEKFEIYREL